MCIYIICIITLELLTYICQNDDYIDAWYYIYIYMYIRGVSDVGFPIFADTDADFAF